MMGYAIRDQRMYMGRKINNNLAVNTKAEKRGYKIVARDKDTGAIVTMFTRESGKHSQQYQEVMRNKKYETAFRFYPLINQAVSNMKTKNRGRTSQWDTMELISEFVQEKYGEHLKPKASEAEMGLEMQADNHKKASQVYLMIHKMYKHNSNFIKNQYFTVIQYDK